MSQSLELKSLPVGMRGISVDEILEGKQGFCLFPAGAFDPNLDARIWVRRKIHALEYIHDRREILVVDENENIREASLIIQRSIILRNMFNKAVAANTNILDSPLVGELESVLLYIQFAFSASGNFNLILTRGGVSETIQLEAAASIIADELDVYTIILCKGDTMNFQLAVNCTVRTFVIQEMIS